MNKTSKIFFATVILLPCSLYAAVSEYKGGAGSHQPNKATAEFTGSGYHPSGSGYEPTGSGYHQGSHK